MVNNESIRNQLIMQAIHTFSEKGYEKSKLTDIGRQCGVSTTVIYSYFRSKDNLFNACVDYSFSQIKAMMTTIHAQSPTLNDFLRNIATVLDGIDDDQRVVFNFYVLMHANVWDVYKVESLVRNFEQSSFNSFATYVKDVTEDDRYWLLIISDIFYAYIFSHFNDYFRRKLMMYTALYTADIEDRSAELKKNIFKILDTLIDQLSETKTLPTEN